MYGFMGNGGMREWMNGNILELCSVQVGSPDTDSSTGVLSPVPGTGFWEPDISLVTLHKGEEGLGFSILDFAVS